MELCSWTALVADASLVVMLTNDLVAAATDLATSVGPLSTLQALDRVNRALDAIDAHLHDDTVIDLGEAEAILAELQPILARAEVRIGDLRSALQGR
jgi:hypothetical protein